MYKCFGCGRYGRAKDLGLSLSTVAPLLRKTPEMSWDMLSRACRLLLNKERKLQLAQQWDVFVDILDSLGCGWLESQQAYTFPLCNEYNGAIVTGK